eukprot:403347519
MDRRRDQLATGKPQSVLTKEDLEEKLKEMKSMIEQQKQLQKQLQGNLDKNNHQNTDKALNQTTDHQRIYPSYEVLYNPTSPVAQDVDNLRVSQSQMQSQYNQKPNIPQNIHQNQDADRHLLTSSQFVQINQQQPNEDADAEYDDYQTPNKYQANGYNNKRSHDKRIHNQSNHKNTQSPAHCVNEENLKFRIMEYQRREKDFEKTIQRLQGKLAIQEEQSIDLREKSTEKQKRHHQDSIALTLEVKELKQQIVYKQGLLDSKERELIQSRRDMAVVQSELSKLQERNDQINNALKSRQNDQVNLTRIVEDLKHQADGFKSQINSLQKELETERKSKQLEITKIEEENKKKFSQLKYLVDQYRDQMSEYHKLTQQNQSLLTQTSGSAKKQRNLSVSFYPKQQQLQDVDKDPQHKTAGRRHYVEQNQNLKDSVKDLFGQDIPQDFPIKENRKESPQKRQPRGQTEYRELCSSAEKHKKRTLDDESISFQDNHNSSSSRITTNIQSRSLAMPSHQKFQDNQQSIQDTESILLKLQQEKNTLQHEYDKIPMTRSKTLKQKQRKEELEGELENISSEIGKLKKKIRDMEITDF